MDGKTKKRVMANSQKILRETKDMWRSTITQVLKGNAI